MTTWNTLLSGPTHAVLDTWSNAAAVSGSICGIPWRITTTGRSGYRLMVEGQYIGTCDTYAAATALRNRYIVELSQDRAEAGEAL